MSAWFRAGFFQKHPVIDHWTHNAYGVAEQAAIFLRQNKGGRFFFRKVDGFAHGAIIALKLYASSLNKSISKKTKGGKPGSFCTILSAIIMGLLKLRIMYATSPRI